MRNLKLLSVCHVSALPDLVGSHDISVDPDTGRIIVVTETAVVALDPQSRQVSKVFSAQNLREKTKKNSEKKALLILIPLDSFGA